MNKKLKVSLEFLAVLVITAIVAISSPLNPWISNTFTDIQNEIMDIAHSVREGYLAYVELDGHYGPVVYELYGLGFLPTDTHTLQFVMEIIMNFFAVLFLYKTAKLYTSNVFACAAAALLAIFGWGSLTHAGAEEIMFFILSLTSYHVARQLKSGYLSHHTYLLAIDFGIVAFLQPGYAIFWILLIIFFAVKFKVDKIDKKEYKSFWFSIIEGILTVGLPMGIYLWYFKNGGAFFQNVVVYNFQNIGSLGAGLQAVCGTPWTIMILAIIISIIVRILKGENFTDLCCWLGIIIVGIIVIALQGENLESYAVLARVLYIVPLASLLSLLDKPLGLKVEEREI